jgi:hypothetical protein
VWGTLNDTQNEERRVKIKMNKKLVALLIPLLLLPLVAFGYAHWTDSVIKKYKFHFGTVEVEVVKWHVDECNAYDANSNAIVFGDEVNVTEVLDAEGELIGFQIAAAPVGPNFWINFTMLLHNKGRLPFEVYAPVVNVSDLYASDPCWGTFTPLATPPSWFVYTYQYYCHTPPGVKNCFNASHYTTPIAATGRVYEPSECIKITQKIWLNVQPDQAALQCHWFKVFVEIPVRNSPGATYSSYHNVTRGWP